MGDGPRSTLQDFDPRVLRRIPALVLCRLGGSAESRFDLPMESDRKEEYERQLLTTSDPKVLAMNKTTYDRGLEKGREEGREEGIREGLQLSLLDLGSLKFGPPSTDTESRIKSIHEVNRLKDFSKRILTAQSWDDLLNAN
jgi:predicted transposase YdaD